MRPASGFAPFIPDASKASWEELAREGDDGATKNYSVPPELIELARANRKARGQVGTLTPLAPKPSQDVVVVVPAVSPVSADIRAGEAANSPQAPSVPVPPEGSGDPDSGRTVVAAAGYAAAASQRPPAMPASAMSPLAQMMRVELAVARNGSEPAKAEVAEAHAREVDAREVDAHEVDAHEDGAEPSEDAQLEVVSRPSESGTVRRTSRRARRSSRIEMPLEASAAARAVVVEPVRSKGYVPVALGAFIVGAYVVLCYYANALLSGLP